MSHSSYTASERRGILAIAIISLLFIVAGMTLSLCGRDISKGEEGPLVVEHPEMIDSAALLQIKEKPKRNGDKSRKTTNKSPKSKSKEKKIYRKRSPLDEPV